MPTRRRTREQSRASGVARQRQLNGLAREAEATARQQKPRKEAAGYFGQTRGHSPGYHPDYGDEPPPF